MARSQNILIVGVGGQGIILAGEVLSSVAMHAGYDVKQSEVHGMAQRGGSVSSHVRFGNSVNSPTIAAGEADVLLSFEMLESLRWADYLSEKGMAVVNRQRIDPMTVASGKANYPTNIDAMLKSKTHRLFLINGKEIAERAGHIKAVNIALLGVLSTLLQFDVPAWETAIRNRVPAKTIDINFKAFHYGRDAASPH